MSATDQDARWYLGKWLYGGDPGCWRSVVTQSFHGVEAHGPCGRPVASETGLCQRHLDELRRESAAVSGVQEKP